MTRIAFDNSYAGLPGDFYTKMAAQPVANAQVFAWNSDLAATLDLPELDKPQTAQIFGGNVTPDGAEPLAQLYAGHQFGSFNPQLGDGRALLLGEVLDRNGQRRDIQLKGSGPTPYSRMGDGRAWLGPVLREYVVSEAMAALGIPTTRALAAVTTGETVYRETVLPGAVLTRVAASHIRVGTFQVFAARQDHTALRALFDYTRARHYPDAHGVEEFLSAVAARQARLVAAWMGVGFIHGVMNTDNCQIAGETIDYGPCAFLDTYHPNTVFSSIDHQGRYAFANQPNIIVWNLAQLATALVPLMPDADQAVQAFTRIIHDLQAQIEADWLQVFGRKIGLQDAGPDDTGLIADLLKVMAENQADFTNTFRALAVQGAAARDQFLTPAAFDAWALTWQDRIRSEPDPEAVMRAANPALIPRNHRIEEMIQAAVAGDHGPFERLMQALAHPFDDQPDFADLARPPSPDEAVQQTFCGT